VFHGRVNMPRVWPEERAKRIAGFPVKKNTTGNNRES
jgi:hypothetical protein